MKRLTAIVVFLFLITGCIARVEKKADMFDKAKAIEASEQLISEFGSALKKELISALSEGGPHNAVAICNVKAPVLADSISSMAGIEIRRVSLKQRNRQIKPDSFEVAVLEKFAVSGSDMPQVYSELILDSADIKIFRYMKEIKVGRLCLNCHGDTAGFSKDLAEMLADRYPDDNAVGYNVGDSRGAFSVVITYPEARSTINKILSENGK